MRFCKKCGEYGGKNNSPVFAAFLTKIHHEIHHISYKISLHRLVWQINVRNAVNAVNAVKKIYHYSTPDLDVNAK